MPSVKSLFWFTISLAMVWSISAEPKSGVVEAGEHLLVLENPSGRLVVSLHGGTILEYRQHELTCPLDVDWKLAADSGAIPPPTPESPFLAQKGHTTWLAPQHEWWKHQELVPDRGMWPPDPWLTTATYKILENSATRLILQSPQSPVSGIQMTKTMTLLDDGRARVQATIKNIRDTDVAWGIWSNTRVNPRSVVLVPISEKTMLKFRFDTRAPMVTRMWEYQIKEGVWFVDTRGPYTDGRKFGGKAFIDSADGVVAAAHGNNLFIKRAVLPTGAGKAAPEHAAIEVYFHHVSETEAALELEMHGAQTTLSPGDSTSFEETWEIIAFAGEPSIEIIISAFKKHLKQAGATLRN